MPITNSDLHTLKLVFNKCNFALSHLNVEKESREYGACSFNLNELKIIFRVSKITPTKVGQFVTIWKRDHQDITQPFNHTDNFDFIIISSKENNNSGVFVLPKFVLAEKGIITTSTKKGKRGIRVYPPWVNVNNKQAEKTQNWQINYFVNIQENNLIDIELSEKLLINNN
jgi:hypothetical protein